MCYSLFMKKIREETYDKIQELEILLSSIRNPDGDRMKKCSKDLYDYYCEIRENERKQYIENFKFYHLISNHRSHESIFIKEFFISRLNINPHSFLDNREKTKMLIDNKINELVTEYAECIFF
jgi:hypothetical protein